MRFQRQTLRIGVIGTLRIDRLLHDRGQLLISSSANFRRPAFEAIHRPANQWLLIASPKTPKTFLPYFHRRRICLRAEQQHEYDCGQTPRPPRNSKPSVLLSGQRRLRGPPAPVLQRAVRLELLLHDFIKKTSSCAGESVRGIGHTGAGDFRPTVPQLVEQSRGAARAF